MAKHELIVGKLQGNTIRVSNGWTGYTSKDVLGYYYELTNEDTITESESDIIAPWEKHYRGVHRIPVANSFANYIPADRDN